jgi:hypothetical protein
MKRSGGTIVLDSRLCSTYQNTNICPKHPPFSKRLIEYQGMKEIYYDGRKSGN